MLKLLLASMVFVWSSCTFSAEDNLPPSLFPYTLKRPGNTLMFWYNPANAPEWVTEDFIEPLLDQVAARWSDCGIQVRYLGHAVDVKGMPSTGIIIWDKTKLPTDNHITRFWPNRQTGIPGKFQIFLNPTVRAGYTLAEQQNFIKKVLFHEVGHAMGLGHPTEKCESVMAQTVNHCKDVKNMIFEPTAQDIVQCKKAHGFQ